MFFSELCCVMMFSVRKLSLCFRELCPDYMNEQKFMKFEKHVMELQKRLISFEGDLGRYLEDAALREYAAGLAAHYYPMWRGNEDYIGPVTDSFLVDLAVAPRLHSMKHLWRYNYDDLDLLFNFYSQSQQKNGYFYLAHGQTPEPTKRKLKQGFHNLRLEVGDYLNRLWDASRLDGKRSNVARRLVDAVCGVMHDREMNERFFFDEKESLRNLKKAEGDGKYRYLRRGRLWMALGTRKQEGMMDIRRETVADLWGYRLDYDDKRKIVIQVSYPNRKRFFADVRAMCERRGAARKRIGEISNYYQRFFLRHRFANGTAWHFIDKWIQKRTSLLRKQVPNAEGKIFIAHKNFSRKITRLPERRNIFWDPQNYLKCDFVTIWNPFR